MLGAAWKLESGVSDREVAVVFGLPKGASPGWPVVSSITSTRITRRIGGGSFGEIYMGIGPNNEKVRCCEEFRDKNTMLCAVGGDQVGVIK